VLAEHAQLGVDGMFQTVAPERISDLVVDRDDSPVLDSLAGRGVRIHAPARQAAGAI